MKTSKTLVIVSLVLLGIALFTTYQLTTPSHQGGVGSSVPKPYGGAEDIRSALGAGLAEGDINTMKHYMADEISLELLGDGDVYFKEEAVELLRNFFIAYPTSGYQEKHRGSSGSGAEQYLVGELATENGTFRTYILTKNAKIIELNVSEE